ncbi:S26 family signal peptidase [Blastococcus brunescens]|uniref:S26 family signal peptidase n=1 Tax=Blastococcus brunescens TaxID=1564165 RepID=A0ABZ1AV08_9ACTN|nr:S26 family signal peptidase [Blastococcus sp. BMG 8361]WRL62413.1 S26 family signal peptidase [Blastococcus sp. BMG 8361]
MIAFVLALLVKTFLVQAFFIPSGSMETTLHGCTGCTGDRVLVTKPRTGSPTLSPGTSSSSRAPTPGHRKCRAPRRRTRSPVP